jgi:hypothetical protein
MRNRAEPDEPTKSERSFKCSGRADPELDCLPLGIPASILGENEEHGAAPGSTDP